MKMIKWNMSHNPSWKQQQQTALGLRNANWTQEEFQRFQGGRSGVERGGSWTVGEGRKEGNLML